VGPRKWIVPCVLRGSTHGGNSKGRDRFHVPDGGGCCNVEDDGDDGDDDVEIIRRGTGIPDAGIRPLPHAKWGIPRRVARPD